MWNRRDYGVLAAAALATFGLTLGTFWPRVANAVDEKPAATTEVKIPTLAIGSVTVTAQLEKDKPHTVLVTVKNTSDEPASAKFKAAAMVSPPSSPLSRSGPLSSETWSSDYALELKASESQTLTVTVPDAAFDKLEGTKQVQQTQAAESQKPFNQNPFNMMTPGSARLMLSDPASKRSITALNLLPTPAQAAPAVTNIVNSVAQALPQATPRKGSQNQ